MILKTAHTLNPVPFYVQLSPADRGRFALASVPQPGLGNVAATLATLLDFSRQRGISPALWLLRVDCRRTVRHVRLLAAAGAAAQEHRWNSALYRGFLAKMSKFKSLARVLQVHVAGPVDV